MIAPIRAVLAGTLVALLGCSPQLAGWRQFQGDLSGRGFQNVKSGFALSAGWVSVPLAITSSSPVIGRGPLREELVYVGTAAGELVALDAQSGAVRRRIPLGEAGERTRVVSTPAVADDDGVVVLATSELANGALAATLHKVSVQGERVWSYRLPDGGFTTSSPKVFRHQGRSLVVVAALLTEKGGLPSELFLFEDGGGSGGLLGRATLGECQGGRSRAAVVAEIKRLWAQLGAGPEERRGAPGEIFFDPTPAVTADGRERPLVVAADNFCALAMLAWDGRTLSVVWRQSHAAEKHASPVVPAAANLVLLGGRSGRLSAYDLETGAAMWTFTTGEPLLATPCATASGVVFALSGGTLHAVLAESGGAVRRAGLPLALKLPGPTLASPVATPERLFIASREMLTLSHDFNLRSYHTGFSGNGLSSPALGEDGALYAVAHDGTVWKYLGGR